MFWPAQNKTQPQKGKLTVPLNIFIHLLLLQREAKETKARKKKTMAALAKLTAPNPEHTDSDLSEAEQGVTAAILSTLKNKDGSPMKKSESPKGPKTRARASKSKTAK